MRQLILVGVSMLLLINSGVARSYTLGSTGFEMSGDISIVFRELDKHSTINTNTRGDDPFNSVRARTFIQKQWTDNIDLYLEFLWDVDADARIQGAYITFYNLMHESVALKVGMIPSPFGNFGHRSTYFNQNPLIGVPAMWLTQSPLAGNGSTRNSDLFPYSLASGSTVYSGGYDACWDYGMNLMLSEGMIEAQLAITLAALSNPYAATNDGYQTILNLGLHPTAGLRFGGSIAYGPWLNGGSTIYDYPPAGISAASLSSAGEDEIFVAASGSTVDVEDFMQTALGAYAEYSFDRFQFFTEFMSMTWETPYIYENEVTANSGYVEGLWGFYPSWEIAGRFDRIWYSEIAPLDDGSGSELPWAPDFNRIEIAVSWRVIREGFIRLDWQHTMFDTDQLEDVDLLALQCLFAF
jgi:hypothetical protein